MPGPYSQDLRERVIALVKRGMSRREVARLCDLGVSTVINWVIENWKPGVRLPSRWAATGARA
jgi:transposase